MAGDGRLFDCSADSNGSIGYRSADDVTIDSCTAIDNVVGFLGGSGGLVIRCTASGNSINYSLSGTRHGEVLSVGGSFNSSNAFANLSY